MEEHFLMISAFLLFTALPTNRACNPIIPGALLNRSNRTLLSLNLAPPPQYTYSDMPTYGQMPSARAAENNADKDLQLAILSTLAEHGIMAEKVLLKYQYSAPKLYLANGNNCTKPDTYVVHDGAILYKCVAAPIRAKRSSMKSEDEAMMTFKNTTEAVNATTPITEDPTARITPDSAANTTTTTSTSTTTTATEYASKSVVSTAAMTQTLTNVTASSENTSTSAVTTASMEGINRTVYSTTTTPEGITAATATFEITVQANETSMTIKGKTVEGTVASTETALLELNSKPNLLKAQRAADAMGNTTAPEASTEPFKPTTTTGATVVSSETIMALKLSIEPSETKTTKASIPPSENKTAVTFSSQPATEDAVGIVEGGVATTELLTTALLDIKSQPNLLKAQRAPDSTGNKTASEVSSTPPKATSTTGVTMVSSKTIAAVGLSAEHSEAKTTVTSIAPSKNKTVIKFTREPSEATTMRGATIALSKNITTAAPIIRSQVTAATEGVNGTVESTVATTKFLTTVLLHSNSQPNILKAHRAADSMGNSTAAEVSTKNHLATPTTVASTGAITASEFSTEPSEVTTTKATIAPSGNMTAIKFSSEPSIATMTRTTTAPSKDITASEFSTESSEATTTTGAKIASSENKTTFATPIITSHVTAATEGAIRIVGNTTNPTKIFTSAALHLKSQANVFESQITAKSIGNTTATEASVRLSEATTPVTAPRAASEAVTISETPFKSSEATTTTGTSITPWNFTTINSTAVGSGKITTLTDLTTKSMEITATSHKTRSYERAAAISNDSTTEATTAAVKQPVDMVKFQIVTAVTVETPQPIPESQWKMYAEKIQEKLEQRHVIFTGDILVKVL